MLVENKIDQCALTNIQTKIVDCLRSLIIYILRQVKSAPSEKSISQTKLPATKKTTRDSDKQDLANKQTIPRRHQSSSTSHYKQH